MKDDDFYTANVLSVADKTIIFTCSNTDAYAIP